jgi:hypothetical protein
MLYCQGLFPDVAASAEVAPEIFNGYLSDLSDSDSDFELEADGHPKELLRVRESLLKSGVVAWFDAGHGIGLNSESCPSRQRGSIKKCSPCTMILQFKLSCDHLYGQTSGL